MNPSKFCIAVAFLISVLSADLHAESYTLWNRNYDTAPVDKIVQLALDKTAAFGTSTLIKSRDLEQDEALEALINRQDLDIMSAAASIETEKKALAISFPVLKGLLGHRVCLIRKGDQNRFDQIETAFDFTSAGIKICQGTHWPDTQTLKRNGFEVWTSPIYKELFDHLKAGRCDCFLRGAQEILPEFEQYQDALAIENKLVIFYHQPGIIYINKQATQLAARIELGLLRAVDDGSYKKLIDGLLDSTLKNLRLNQRHYIRINNPLNSERIKQLSKSETLWF